MIIFKQKLILNCVKGGDTENGGFSGGLGQGFDNGAGGSFSGGMGQGYNGNNESDGGAGGGWGIDTNPFSSTYIAADTTDITGLSVEEAQQNKQDIENQQGGWDWGGFLQGLALGFEIAGIPGAGAGAVIGGTHNMIAGSAQQNKAVSQATGVQQTGSSEGGGGKSPIAQINQNAATGEEVVKPDQGPSPESGNGGTVNPSDQASKAEDKERRRGFGYLDAMTGETDVMLSALWNPNISLGRNQTFY